MDAVEAAGRDDGTIVGALAAGGMALGNIGEIGEVLVKELGKSGGIMVHCVMEMAVPNLPLARKFQSPAAKQVPAFSSLQ